MKKVKVTIEGSGEVGSTTYDFYNESDLETLIHAVVDEDEEAMDEIEENGGAFFYMLDLGKAPYMHLSQSYVEYPWFDFLEVEVDGEVVLKETDINWEEDAVSETNDYLKPAYDLIAEKKEEKLYAFENSECDRLDFSICFEFEIDGDFDRTKFHFMKAGSGFNSEKAVYDGKIVEGRDDSDGCPDHADRNLCIFTSDGIEKFEAESY